MQKSMIVVITQQYLRILRAIIVEQKGDKRKYVELKVYYDNFEELTTGGVYYSGKDIHAFLGSSAPRVDSLSLRPFSHVDANGCEENGLASQCLVDKMSGEYQAIKSILPLKRSLESMNTSICINCSPEIVPAFSNIISSSPYSKLLMQRQYTELTPDVCAVINKDWDFFPQIKFATVQIFAGVILYNTTNGQTIMLNTVEAYGRTKSIDPHREQFGKIKEFTKPTSLPPPGKIPYSDIWPISLHTTGGTKLIIGTLVSNILVTSSMRFEECPRQSKDG